MKVSSSSATIVSTSTTFSFSFSFFFFLPLPLFSTLCSRRTVLYLIDVSNNRDLARVHFAWLLRRFNPPHATPNLRLRKRTVPRASHSYGSIYIPGMRLGLREKGREISLELFHATTRLSAFPFEFLTVNTFKESRASLVIITESLSIPDRRPVNREITHEDLRLAGKFGNRRWVHRRGDGSCQARAFDVDQEACNAADLARQGQTF